MLELHPYFLRVALYALDTATPSSKMNTDDDGSSSDEDLDKIDDSSDDEFQEIDNKKLEFLEIVTSAKSNLDRLLNQLKEAFSLDVSSDHLRLWRAFRSNPHTIVGDGVDEATIEDLSPGGDIGCELVLEVKSADGEWPLWHKEKQKQKLQRNDYAPSGFRSFSSNYGLSSSLGTSSYLSDGNGRPSPPGVCGLGNLGNTCFMNSALQCLTKTPSIREYFVSDKFRMEINKTNPLGMGGKIAMVFGNLMKNMWTGQHSVITPREFKQTIGRFAPQFSGYQQQDSQELIAYLLDGLHEDLNRIKDKPLTEQVESNGRPDHIVADEAWSVHKKRNDSIIVDLFQGQLKSTLVCPNEHCVKEKSVSVTFDPFMYLSLPLPTEKTVVIPVTFISHGAHSRPVKLAVSTNKHGTCRQLREDLCRMISEDGSLDPNNVVLADIFNHKVYRYYSDFAPIDSIRSNDVIYAYEVPGLPTGCHSKYGSSSRYGSTDDSGRTFASIKFQSRVSQSYSTYDRDEDILEPFVVKIDRESTTAREIYDQALEHIKLFIDPEKLAENGLDTEDQLQRLVPKDKKHENISELDDTSMQCDDQENAEQPQPMIMLLQEKSSSRNALYYNEDLADPVTEDNEEDTDTFLSSHIRRDSIKDYTLWIDPELMNFLNINKKHAAPQEHPSILEMRGSDDRGVSLDECLDLFTTSEKLGPEDPWYCPRCKEFVQATKKFDIWSLPEVLVIHLKRFQYNRYSRDKLDTFVDFPIEELDMTPHVPEGSLPYQKHLKYELFGVSNHMGGLGGGHYTAYAKINDSGKWYLFDDSHTRETSAASVKSSSAYLLFYRAKKKLN